MLKTYLSEHHLSIYRLAKISGVPYSTLNDLSNHKLPIENLRSGQLKAIADALCTDMNTLYELCQVNKTISSTVFHTSATISIEHKKYYLNFEKNQVEYKYELLPVKKESTIYLETLAQWKLDEILSHLEMEAAYETIHTKKAR